MNILILGSGGREHALANYCAAHHEVKEVIVIPGNPGMGLSPKIRCMLNDPTTPPNLIALARREAITMVIVGPEQPLVAGIVDALIAADIPVLGPSQSAAQLEGSKLFAKQIMSCATVPTAAYAEFTSLGAAHRFIDHTLWRDGYVIKADELASGKGVIVCADRATAKQAVTDLLEGHHLGRPSQKILIEERLLGRELSSFYLCLEDQAMLIGHACDYKRLDDDDQGPNTGGMGSYSPVSWLDRQTERELESRVVKPILQEMLRRNTPFTGILFVGSMITTTGVKVLEFNVRFGDPEAQCILPLAAPELLDALLAIATRDTKAFANFIARVPQLLSRNYAVHVVCVNEGYPTISAASRGEVPIWVDQEFFANSKTHRLTYAAVKTLHGNLTTKGGRILGVTGIGATLSEARSRAYSGINRVTYVGKKYRHDIGKTL